jgi:hypothetical protein
MRSGWLRAALLCAVALMVGVAEARADRRVALVIGNSAYKNVGKLPNPGNDAAAVAKLFTDAGFDVVESKRDLSIADMRRAVRDFSNTARDADISVIYYAGHGIEVDGTNYLIPTDAVLESDVDIEDETLSLDRFLKSIEPTKRLRLVILDACRDNPFSKTMKRSIGSRAVSRGLAKVEPQSSDTLIAFAAKAGSTASDGDGGNSPFARAIVKNIAVPGVDLRIAFGRVRDEVMKVTNSRQEPFVYGSLGGSELSLVPPKAAPAAAPVVVAPAAPAADPQAEARRDYEFVERIGTVQAWDAFLEMHKDGMFANLARAQRAKLAAAEATKAAESEKAAKAETARAAAATKALEEAKAAEERANKRLEAVKAAEAKAEAAKAETAKAAAAKTEGAGKVEEIKVAAVTPPADASKPAVAGPAPGEVARSLQTELRRVGCFAANVDGTWSAASIKALDAFNRYSGMKLDSKTASLDALDAIKQKGSRICPLTCDKGFEAKGEACVAKTCPAGQELDNDGDCAKVKTAARPEPKDPAPKAAAPKADKPATAAKTAEKKPAASTGQIYCGPPGGCRPVPPGCSIGHSGSRPMLICP